MTIQTLTLSQIQPSVLNPRKTDLKANDWLPEAMNFPAIDPDRASTQSGDIADKLEDEDAVLGEDDEQDDDYAEAA